MVNDQEIEALIQKLRELEAKATKGPWYATCTNYGDRCGPLTPQSHDAPVYTVSTKRGTPGWENDGGHPGYGISQENAEFIAFVRTNILKILDALDDNSLRS